MLRRINGTALIIAALVATLGALVRPDGAARSVRHSGTAGAGAGGADRGLVVHLAALHDADAPDHPGPGTSNQPLNVTLFGFTAARRGH
ncbi:hypothetical protein ACIQZB_22510 [Streptomyces sp. NPDC097727]|uniref:hypothetical protein n=1 Tax=Streptomyces sp. NPDC097727 TaxID=3366092 RepID=UPI003829EF96